MISPSWRTLGFADTMAAVRLCFQQLDVILQNECVRQKRQKAGKGTLKPGFYKQQLITSPANRTFSKARRQSRPTLDIQKAGSRARGTFAAGFPCPCPTRISGDTCPIAGLRPGPAPVFGERPDDTEAFGRHTTSGVARLLFVVLDLCCCARR